MKTGAIASLLLLASVGAASADQPKEILATMERVADWELAHPDQASAPKSNRQTQDPLGWVVGAFYTGLTALADRSPRYADAIMSLGNQKNWALGPRPFHADDYEVAQNWVWAYRRQHDPRMIAAVRQRFDAIMAAHLTDSLLMVPVSSSLGGCFRRWCWCDALFMAPMGWISLGQAVNDPRYLAYADKEFHATTALLFDPSQSLYYRDSSYFGKTGPHGEKIFWSRGNGWVYAALARILTVLPANSPSRPYYQDLFLKMSHKLVSLQKPDGSWAPSLLDPRRDTVPETSGTGFFTYGLAWGVHAGLLKDPIYRRAAERGWSLLAKAVQPDGKLGWVQQVGSEPDNVAADYTQPFGVGAFLLAGSAMIDIAAVRP
ncbi:MAG TPA: glycoside hydrolase family 88 protein [Rhizomicrobium sp.]|jgi:rhamnogalacturonyl hydrolase YesR|nr:glycoside hydrolase family 88 protein [Rhizomicrobium sp.]